MDEQEICKAMENFTNPVRLKILQLLVEGERTLEELSSQMSEHDEKDIRLQLSMLEQRDFISSESGYGKTVYEVAPKTRQVAKEISDALRFLGENVLLITTAKNRDN